MLISLVLGYKKFKNCSLGIYSEELILGDKNKKKCMGLFAGERSFILGILGFITILRFRLETIYFDNNKYCYILLNKFTLSSVVGGIE